MLSLARGKCPHCGKTTRVHHCKRYCGWFECNNCKVSSNVVIIFDTKGNSFREKVK